MDPIVFDIFISQAKELRINPDCLSPNVRKAFAATAENIAEYAKVLQETNWEQKRRLEAIKQCLIQPVPLGRMFRASQIK